MTDQALALAGGTIYLNPDDSLRDGVVLIRDGRIAAVGDRSLLRDDIESIDCSGMTVAAGFWNTHVHFFERKWANAATLPAAEVERQLEAMLTRYGFTTVFDLSSSFENTRALRQRIESAEVHGPRIFTTGEGLIAAGTGPSDTVLNMMGVMKTPLPEVADPTSATAAAKELIEKGVDAIKAFALAEPLVEAVAAVAHRAGKKVFAHPNSSADVIAALRGGADVIAHTTPRTAWDDAIVTLASERRVALTPTLTLWRFFMRHDRASVQEQFVSTAIDQLRSWIAAGAPVLFGTDLGAVDPDPAEEYALMRRAGMTFRDILAALTTSPAAYFGADARITEGAAADLVVFRGEDFGDVKYVLRNGTVIYRSS